MLTPLLMITCDEELVAPLHELMRSRGLDAQASERRNLDGAALTSWLVLAGVAVKVAPELLREITGFLGRDRVRRIEYDGFVIENPRPQDVDELVRRMLEHPDSDDGDSDGATE
ncbi:MAG: hypothetical protein JWP34_5075 [Massilia sp.]|nr:hypothetical protein [Massilia sp.]